MVLSFGFEYKIEELHLLKKWSTLLDQEEVMRLISNQAVFLNEAPKSNREELGNLIDQMAKLLESWR